MKRHPETRTPGGNRANAEKQNEHRDHAAAAGNGQVEQIATSPNLPRRRGKAASTLDLEMAILEIVEERAPITVRGVCYALFTKGFIPDMSKGSTGKVSRIMTDMRECDDLDWTQIVDGGREPVAWAMWDNPDERIRQTVAGYRRNNWQDQPLQVEVWSEKSTIQGVLEPVLANLGVTFRVMKGFGSFTAVRQAAEDSLDLPEDKPLVALYLGDWDPSGLYMSEADLPERLDRYGFDGEFKRIALVKDDLDYLPHFDVETKSSDARYRWFQGYSHYIGTPTGRCWELDAMDPNDLRERVGAAIEQHMDMDIWNRALEVEAAERESMQQFHKAWTNRISGQAKK